MSFILAAVRQRLAQTADHLRRRQNRTLNRLQETVIDDDTEENH